MHDTLTCDLLPKEEAGEKTQGIPDTGNAIFMAFGAVARKIRPEATAPR